MGRVAPAGTTVPRAGSGDGSQPASGTLRLVMSVRVTVMRVSQIDTLGQRFVADLYAAASAIGQRAALEEAGLYATIDPRLRWCNGKPIEIRRDWTRLNRGDDVEFHFAGTLEFEEAFELERFPFDSQSLSMDLGSDLPASADDCKLLVELVPVRPGAYHVVVGKPDPGPLLFLRESFLLGASWTYRSFSIQHWLSLPDTSATGKQYRHLQFSLHFQRAFAFYVYKMLLPLFLLTSLSFCVFSMDPLSATSDRLNLTVTLLLTAAAMNIVVASSLPVVSYLTWLDVYILTCSVLLVVMTVETAVVCKLRGRAAVVDEALAYALSGLWAAFNLCYGLAGWRMARKRSLRVEVGVGYETMVQSGQ